MSIRSFRDRYGALEQSVQPSAEASSASREWPVPDGARVLSTAHGPTVVWDSVFDGPDLSVARTWLAEAGITRDLDTTLFIDTETTGLAGGTGTHVFLVGVGRFDGPRFVVRQFFLRHPGEERALLAAVESDLSEAGALVTYNGRTFDIPLLQTRFRMHHRDCPVPDTHFDLLHPVRSVWKHRLPGCALGTVERDILGVTRVDDAPGWMIPQLYFTYLQSRRVETLSNVFNHNRQDIISLARIAALVHAYQSGLERPDHPIDRLCVALLQLRSGDLDRSLPVIHEEFGSVLIPGHLRLRAAREISTALKRQRRFEEAVVLWERGLSDPSRAVRAHASEELAKYLEHRVRDHRRALAIAHRAADGARLVGDTGMVVAFEKRVARLERKLHAVRGHVPEDEYQEWEQV